MDVVYSHTAEGDHHGPALSFKGIDNAAYYRRLVEDDPSSYLDMTGTGNSFNLGHLAALGLIMVSLRYWVTEMHIDGFRFDLATALTRQDGSAEGRHWLSTGWFARRLVGMERPVPRGHSGSGAAGLYCSGDRSAKQQCRTASDLVLQLAGRRARVALPDAPGREWELVLSRDPGLVADPRFTTLIVADHSFSLLESRQ